MSSIDKVLERYPINGTFELTLRCNLNCKMCMFRHADCENACLAKDEMTTQQWIDMAKQVFEAGTINLLFTGGEPLVREDFCEIYEAVYKMGFIITLYTNASLVNEKHIELFKKFPPHRIGITLYGASNETYEKVCGVAGAFERALYGMRLLKTLPSAIDYRMTLTKESADDADKIEDLIQKEFGATVTLTEVLFNSVRGGCASVASCRLSPKESIDLIIDRTAKRLRNNLTPEQLQKISVKLADAPVECKPEKEKNSIMGCNGGMDSYTITWDGKLLGCQMLDKFQTNALELGFKEAWAEFPFVVKMPEMNEECGACELYNKCRICLAVNMAESGCMTGKPEYICEITKLLEEKRGVELL